ncbi:major capsid protein [Ralstonia syzygii]|uniref:major capsid protein n=1 Tax=Ralstonia syzygii TaxID=28097 RepID=UPI00351111C0
MGRLSNLRVVDPVLTQLSIGYTNADLVGDVLFPFVPVDKEGGKIPKFGKEAFKIYNTERALRARSNRINPEDVDAVTISLDEHDLEYPIDYRETAEAAFPLEAHATHVVTEGIRLRHEKKVADLVQSQASYAASNKIVLAGTSRFTDKANSDPIGVIEDGKEAVRGKIGRYPNTAVIGAAAWKALKQHPAFIERIKYSMKGILTVDLVKEILEVDNIVVGKAVYASDTGVFSDLWGDNIVLAYVAPGRAGNERTPYEPSFGYTLRKKGVPMIDTRVEDGKLELVRNTDNFQVALLGAEAGYLIADTNA